MMVFLMRVTVMMAMITIVDDGVDDDGVDDGGHDENYANVTSPRFRGMTST